MNKNTTSILRQSLATLLLCSTALTGTALAGGHGPSYIGSGSALIAEASTADSPNELTDGKSGDVDFPFIRNMKVLANVGEVDPVNGLALTGYPDGNAVWLADENTIRVGYQSESYATMSNETYGWEMQNGVKFTGSHIHTIDFDRAEFADFLNNNKTADEMFITSGKIFDTVYNQFGDIVKPKSEGGIWGNQTLADGTVVEFDEKYKLTEGDFFFQSFCGAHLEKANKYGNDIGFADDIWFAAEEWNIQRMFEESGINTHDTLGLASIAIDVKNGVAYTVPAMGQTGYEKILPVNSGHKDYVVAVMAGYNHGVEPAPLKIYIGKKGVDADNNVVDQNGTASERDKFLARNGLLYGKLYGMAVANEDFASLGIEKIDTLENMMDSYLQNPNASNNFSAKFVPTSYQWGGWDTTPAVKDTEMQKWQLAEEQPAGHTYFVGDSKTEHPAGDPDISKFRYFQNMTNKGGLLGVEFTELAAELDAANGELPALISADVSRTLAAIDGALALETGGKGIKHGGMGDASTWEDGRAQLVAPDGLQWVKTSDADVLILDEDSGNEFGERKMALPINPDTFQLAESGVGYFLAQAGGKQSPRAAAGVSALGGSFSKATSSEFSGSWNVTAMITKKSDGSFYTMEELAGVGEQQINETVSLADSTFFGVVQHKGESGGMVEQVKGDQGGQLFLFNMNLPN